MILDTLGVQVVTKSFRVAGLVPQEILPSTVTGGEQDLRHGLENCNGVLSLGLRIQQFYTHKGILLQMVQAFQLPSTTVKHGPHPWYERFS